MIKKKRMLKKTLFILSLPFVLAGCAGNNSGSKNSTDTGVANAKTTANGSNPDSVKSNNVSIATSPDKGAQLIIKNDCRNCHREREKLIGPAFSDVSRKYNATDIDSLANKIIKGGSGHWGDAAMSPHPTLSMDDAKEIVKFILTIK
jgi:cytochrome c